MSLLLSDSGLSDRRAVASGPFRVLADSLAADLEPLLNAPPYFPDEKALLSRIGGRCETDGTELEFDPMSPRAHRCPTCAHVHTGEYHDRWWIYPYQLWLAERAVHAAVFAALTDDDRYLALARTILTGYADRYLEYPNRDNVLGPSHLFFSTYLESLWLLHVCIAADLLERAGDSATADDVRARIVRPAVDLIAEYDEGLSNRQVWNDAALIAGGLFLGNPVDSSGVSRALAGIETILTHAVGEDGVWYEGDNYHQFAHRGLWYAITLGEQAGYAFDAELLERFHSGFATPFNTALPDFSYPARKDSRYVASLRQWRFAESAELGISRCKRPADLSVLHWARSLMYAPDIAAGDTGRARSSGEAERHVAPVRLSRADLGWRSLLFASPERDDDTAQPPDSLTVESQGLTIHRRDRGASYVALDWGASGGGHGHPDRLNLLFSRGAVRLLDDMGTGSYVDESLHWYRSTLAHNAPLVDGASQARVDGECVGAGSEDGFDFIAARVYEIAPGVIVDRTVVTGADYFIDEVRWTAAHDVRFELPIHFSGDSALTFTPRVLNGGFGLEDGFAHVRSGEATEVAAHAAITLTSPEARAVVWSDQDVELFRATGPGQPATTARRFYVVRCQGAEGIIRSVWSWASTPPTVEFADNTVEVTAAGSSHEHESNGDGWTIRSNGSSVAHFDREGIPEDIGADDSDDGMPQHLVAPRELHPHAPQSDWFSDLGPAEQDEWQVVELGEGHYRRSEESWRDADRPSARISVTADDDGIVVEAFVETAQPVFVPADATNPLDNEHPDINGHGVQLYIATNELSGGWVLVPEAGTEQVRIRRLTSWGTFPDPEATWRTVPGGFELRARLPYDTSEPSMFGLDVLVNDTVPDRLRRRGQLVMSGVDGEFAYLMGDRHDPARLIPFSID